MLRLAGDRYEDDARVLGTAAYATEDPFSIRVVPAELLGTLPSRRLIRAERAPRWPSWRVALDKWDRP